MTFANPIFLWSLLGLSIPIAIHLLSRKEGKVIRLGSVRHVRETSTQQFKGIKLNEILLLVLRCAMIVIFSLLLGGLQLTISSDKKLVFVEAGLETNSGVKTILDSLNKEGFEQKQLNNDSDSTINYWSIIEKLRTSNFSEAIVLAKNRIQNFKGARPALLPNIKWIAVPSEPIDFSTSAVQLDQDIFLRTGHSTANETYFTTETVKSSSMQTIAPELIKINLINDEAHAYDQKIIEAALDAIKNSFPVKIQITRSETLKEKMDWCIWLSSGKKPSTSKIISMEIKDSKDLVTQAGSNQWIITRRLNEEVSLKENLTLRLAKILLPSNYQARVTEANDNRVMPDSMAWSKAGLTATGSVTATAPADRMLIICLLVLLLTERILAYKRNQ